MSRKRQNVRPAACDAAVLAMAQQQVDALSGNIRRAISLYQDLVRRLAQSVRLSTEYKERAEGFEAGLLHERGRAEAAEAALRLERRGNVELVARIRKAQSELDGPGVSKGARTVILAILASGEVRRNG
jgi:hypothetical protein